VLRKGGGHRRLCALGHLLRREVLDVRREKSDGARLNHQGPGAIEEGG
jgi:hypothetical protein